MTEYWFRKRKGLFSKDMGWGWTPVSWEGWILLAAMILACLGSAWFFIIGRETPNFFGLAVGVIAPILLLILISMKKSVE